MTKELVCGQEESKGHTHSDDCYTEEKVLVCTLEEDDEHTHGDECYETGMILTCGRQEIAGHSHSDACYETTRELTCSIAEHVHTDDCFADPDAETAAATKEAQPEETAAQPAENAAEAEQPSEESTAAGETEAEETSAEETEAEETSGEEPTTAEETETADAADPAVPAPTTAAQKLEFDGADYQITVDCPAEAGIPSEASLEVSEIVIGTEEHDQYLEASRQMLDLEEDAEAYGRFFDINILDAEGNQLQPAVPVDVKITFDEADAFEEPQVVHFEEEAPVPVEAEKQDDAVSFEAEGFSVYGILEIVPGTEIPMTEESTETIGPNYTRTFYSKSGEGSILDGVTFDDANEWQIVDEAYTNNAAENKIPSPDGNVRVQKNILPTGVENEFYVYLSIDTRLTEEMMTEILKQATYKYGSSQHFPHPVQPAVNPGDKWGNPGDTFAGVQGSIKDDGDHDQEIKLYHDGVYVGSAWAAADCSNYQVYLVL